MLEGEGDGVQCWMMSIAGGDELTEVDRKNESD